MDWKTLTFVHIESGYLLQCNACIDSPPVVSRVYMFYENGGYIYVILWCMAVLEGTNSEVIYIRDLTV